jgi:aspartate/methionine/tyrosine aminotransferase
MIYFSDSAHSSLTAYDPEGTMVTVGLSKSFAAGGYRWGVRVAPADYDSATVLKAWAGNELMNETRVKNLFPQLVGGCDSLEAFIHEFA